MDKAMTLRLSADQAREAEVVARADGVSVNQLVRTALAEKIAARRKNKDFQKRVRQILDEDREILERLAR
jgi:hypothetical protein